MVCPEWLCFRGESAVRIEKVFGTPVSRFSTSRRMHTALARRRSHFACWNTRRARVQKSPSKSPATSPRIGEIVQADQGLIDQLFPVIWARCAAVVEGRPITCCSKGLAAHNTVPRPTQPACFCLISAIDYEKPAASRVYMPPTRASRSASKSPCQVLGAKPMRESPGVAPRVPYTRVSRSASKSPCQVLGAKPMRESPGVAPRVPHSTNRPINEAILVVHPPSETLWPFGPAPELGFQGG